MTTTTGGVTLETTYAAYISSTQTAGTYAGKVIYTLVHPASAPEPVKPDQVGVTFNGNGLMFTDGVSKNRVVYKNNCTETGRYIGNTPTISKTPNVNDDGTATSGYAYNMTQTDPVTIAGASELKVELQYGIENNYDYLYVFQGTYNGEVTGEENAPMEAGQMATYTGGNNGFIAESSDTLYVTGDTVTFAFFSDDYQDDGHYGYYAKVYPLYTTEQPDTTADTLCSMSVDTGTYAETTTWKGKWYMTINGNTTWFENEAAVISYLDENSANLLGTNIELYAYNPYTIIYNGNSATAGTMTGFTTSMDTTSSTANLMAPNFKRTGYGFAGWSEEASATINSSSKIYGPNEKVLGSDLTFNSSTHETTLYAVWAPTSGNMQSFSCSSLGGNQITALTDARDGNIYTVGKMQDGNCWMMENLRLDNNATTPNWGNNNLSQGFGGVFTGLAASEDNFSGTTANSLYSTTNITGNYQGYRFPRYNNNNTNIGGNNASGTSLIVAPGRYDGSNWSDDAETLGESGDNYQWYGYGNYYTLAAAMANTTNMASISASEAVSTSICPAGWSLPYGNSTGNGAANGSFSYLDKQMGGTGSYQDDNEGEEIVSNRWRSYPNNFVYSGYWYGSSADGRGGIGYYWSRTANGNYSAYDLYFGSTHVGPGSNNSSKSNGYSVRCMAQ